MKRIIDNSVWEADLIFKLNSVGTRCARPVWERQPFTLRAKGRARHVPTIVALFLLLPLYANAQNIPQLADAAMHRVFGPNAVLSKKLVDIDAAMATRVRERSGQPVYNKAIVHIASVNGTIVGYGIVDDVRGKAQPITYITLFKPDGTIADIEVLVYRESYGGEIAYPSFRNQFRGKNANSPLRVGSDIENVAGATISSNAIANGAKKIAVLFDELRKAGKL